MSNLVNALTPQYPEKISTIRVMHPILARFSDCEIGRIWEVFSDSRCASWLIPDGENLTDFAEWITE